jgi:hypothetical protein
MIGESGARGGIMGFNTCTVHEVHESKAGKIAEQELEKDISRELLKHTMKKMARSITNPSHHQ